MLHLELVYRELLTQEQLDGHSSTITRACFMISTAIETLERLKMGSNNHCCRAPVVQSGHVGRPRFDIPQEQMIALVENCFTGPQMAEIVGVSLSTIRRRMVLFQLSVSSEYTTMSDAELDNIIHEIKREFPTCGNKQMLGHLYSRGSEYSKYVSENLSGE